MAQLIRLNEFTAIEFASRFSADLNTRTLYRYDFDSQPKSSQLLSGDAHDNARQFSYSPYIQNILLDPTPRPYYKNHAQKELSVLLGDPTLPSIEYWSCKLHTAAGFKYSTSSSTEHNDVFGIAFRVYVKVNGDREVTLASIADTYTNSRMKPNSREVIFENVIFGQCIEFSVPDISFLMNSTNPEIVPIRELLLGTDIQSISEYFIEYSVIDEFSTHSFIGDDGFEYSYLVLSNTLRNYYQETTYNDELISHIDVSEMYGCLQLRVLHLQYDIEQYLSQFCGIDEHFIIRHELTTSYFNENNDHVSTESTEIRNVVDSFLPVLYRPVLPSGVPIDHAQFELRSTMINERSGMSIVRYSMLVLTDLSMFEQVKFNVQVDTLQLRNVNNVTQNVLMAVNDVPLVQPIIKPYYVFTQPTGLVRLFPYDTTISVALEDAKFSSKLHIKFEDRTYTATEQSATNAIFTIPASEYNSKNESFFVCDNEGQVVTYGKVERVQS